VDQGHRQRDVRTDIELAALRLRGSELPVRQFEPTQRYPVPDSVRLLDDLPEQAPRPVYRGHKDRFWLEWTYGWTGLRWTPPIEGCLDAFIDLADARPEEILEFAQTWGVLGICKDGEPVPHWDEQGRWCHPFGVPPLGGAFDPPDSLAWEPLRPWYRYARTARGIVGAAARLQRGEPPDDDDWRNVEGGVFSVDPHWLDADLEKQSIDGPNADAPGQRAYRDQVDRRFQQHMAVRRAHPDVARTELAKAASTWLEHAELVPRLRWDTMAASFVAVLAPPEPDFWSGNYGYLFGVLGIQIAAAVCSPLYRCSICHRVYSLEDETYRPRRGQRRFCSIDCAAAAKREANLRSYHKNKQEWRNQRRRKKEGSNE
jgi:hypothetical protein